MNRALFLISLFVYFPFFLFAQFSQNSSYQYRYKLSDTVVKKMVEENDYKVEPYMLHQLVDSIPYNTDNREEGLKPGYYAICSVNGRYERNSFFEITDFEEPQIIYGEKELWLFVFNKSHKADQVQVFLDGESLPYDAQTGTFHLDRVPKKGLLLCQSPEEKRYLRWSYTKQKQFFKVEYPTDRAVDHTSSLSNKEAQKGFWPFRFAKNSLDLPEGRRGYLAMNLPKYRPGDTVKIKAYVLHPETGPYQDSLTLTLIEGSYEPKGIFYQNIAPKEPGVFQYEFVLGDTLKIDQSYTLLLGKEGDNIENQFYLEDYELEEVRYQIEVESEYRLGREIKIICRGKDVNDLPIKDGSVELEIGFQGLVDDVDHVVRIPYQMYTAESYFDGEGKAEFVLTDSVFPNYSASYSVNANFLNSNRESQEINRSFRLIKRLDHFEAEIEGDVLSIIHYPDSSGIEADSASITYIRNSEEVQQQTFSVQVALPYREKITVDSIFSVQVKLGKQEKIIYYKNYQSKQVVSTYYGSNEVEIDGFYRNDTAIFSIKNPQGVPIFYQLYLGNKRLKKGIINDHQEIQRYNANGALYRLDFQYILNGSRRHSQVLAYPKDKILQVELLLPDSIYPGEEVEGLVRIKDQDGQPVEGVNLTSFGVNGQFHRSNIPSLPHSDPARVFRADKQTAKTYSKNYRSNQRVLKRSRLPLYKLEDSVYFQLTFPDSISRHYIPIEQKDRVLFAPYIFKEGQQENIYMIWTEDGLVYFNRGQHGAYCMEASKAGKQDLYIRTADSLYHLRDIELRKGFKLELSIHPTQFPSYVSVSKRPDHLTQNEALAIQRTHFWLNIPKHAEVYLWQDGMSLSWPSSNYSQTSLVGPFLQDSVHFLIAGDFGRKIKWKRGFRHDIQLRKEILWEQATPKARDGLRFFSDSDQLIGQMPIWADSIVHQGYNENQDEGLGYFYPDPYYLPNQNPELGFLELMFPNKGLAGIQVHQVCLIPYHDAQNHYLSAENYDYYAYAGSFAALNPGYYRVLLANKAGQIHLIDSLFIQKGHGNYYPIDSLRFQNNPYWASYFESKYQVQHFDGLKHFVNARSEGGSGKINGQISSQQDNSAISSTEIWLLHQEKLIKGALSDARGQFSIGQFPADLAASGKLLLLHPAYQPQIISPDESGEWPASIQLIPLKSESYQKALENSHNWRYYEYPWQRPDSSIAYMLSYEGPPRQKVNVPGVFYQNLDLPAEKVLYFNDQFQLASLPAAKRRPEFTGPFDENQDQLFPPKKRKPVYLGIAGGLPFLQGDYVPVSGLSGQIFVEAPVSPILNLRLTVGGLQQSGLSNGRHQDYLETANAWSQRYDGSIYTNYQQQMGYAALSSLLRLTGLGYYQGHRRTDLFLKIGAGLQYGQVYQDVLNGIQSYDFDQFPDISTEGSLNKWELRRAYLDFTDGTFEQAVWMQARWNPYVQLGAEARFRLGSRGVLSLAYESQWSGQPHWSGQNGSSTPEVNGIHIFQLGIGLMLRKSSESLWWTNPLETDYTGELAEVIAAGKRSKATGLRYSYSSDNDGVPDLYDEEAPSPVSSSLGFMEEDNWLNIEYEESAFYDGAEDVPYSQISLAGASFRADSIDANGRLLDLLNVSGEEIVRLGGMPAEFGDFTVLLDAFRTNFQDYAYWEPNFYTDAKGEARFSITFPDDITSWNCYVLAMNGVGQAGIGQEQVRAFQPVSGRLAMPRFLIEGDSALATGKVVNYDADSVSLTSRFFLDEKLVFEQDTTIKDLLVDRPAFHIADTGNYLISYGLETKDGFIDGESRELDVYQQGTSESSGKFLYLESDSSLELSFDPVKGPVEIRVQENVLELLLKDLDALQRYPYGCNEQNASRLLAYLWERQVREAMDQPFEHEAEVRKMARKLRQAQNKNGSWGWWAGNPMNLWMSAYITKALWMADSTDKAVQKGLVFLQNQLAGQKSLEKNHLHILLHLAEMEATADLEIDSLLKGMDMRELTLYERMLYSRIRQLKGLDYEWEYLLETSHKTILGGLYWGNSAAWAWYGSHSELTLLAYDILGDVKGQNQNQQKIRQYFLAHRNPTGWRNTAESAQILARLVPDLLAKSVGATSLAQLNIQAVDYQKNLKEYPFIGTISANQPIRLSKSGTGPLYISLSQSAWLKNPAAVDSLFLIKSYFKEADQEANVQTAVKQLKAGEAIQMVVEVEAKAAADYLVLNVPIPAGCSYGEKSQLWDEAHREYYRHQCNIFLRHVSEGHHRYIIDLEPRFEGSYRINPAKMEMMYAPMKFGRNEVKDISVR